MPHVRAIFLEHNWESHLTLQENKTKIRQVVADCTGYELDTIALIPEMIPLKLHRLSENLLVIEFVIDVGIKCRGRVAEMGQEIYDKLAVIEGLSKLKFGVWLRMVGENHFQLHNPK